MYNSTVNYLDEFNLVTEHQSGFRSGHSTISAIADFTDDIYRAINNSNITHTVFIDFSKAFDTINHEILLKKLFHLGFKQSSINWFQNYLTNRKQRIIANNKFSDLKDIVCGVPQGSILGPLLFLLYVNDLGDCLQYTKYKLYADDTVLYLSTPLRYNYDELLNKDLLNMHNWCQENKLTVNLKKTKYMATASSSKKLKKLREAKITMGGVELQKTTEFKYLGITIDNCLNFNKHVSVLNQTVSHKIYLLNKIRWFIKEEDSINIYKTMILPHLTYGDVIYSATSKGNLKKLQKIQNRGIRTCIRPQNKTPVKALHKKASINKLKHLREASLLCFAYKRAQKTKYLDRRGIRTRAHDYPVLKVENNVHSRYTKSVQFRTFTAWSKAKGEMKASTSYTQLKSKLAKVQKDRLT